MKFEISREWLLEKLAHCDDTNVGAGGTSIEMFRKEIQNMTKQYKLHGRELRAGDRVWSTHMNQFVTVTALSSTNPFEYQDYYIHTHNNLFSWDEPDLSKIPPPLFWCEGHPVREGTAMYSKLKKKACTVINKFEDTVSVVLPGGAILVTEKSSLTFDFPTPLFWCENRPVFAGDEMYISRDMYTENMLPGLDHIKCVIESIHPGDKERVVVRINLPLYQSVQYTVPKSSVMFEPPKQEPEPRSKMVEVTKWANVYLDSCGCDWVGGFYASEEEAKRNVSGGPVPVIQAPITYMKEVEG
jgi:hypothetical protein